MTERSTDYAASASTPREQLRAAYAAWDASKGKSVDTWLALIDDNFQMRSVLGGQVPHALTQARSSREELRGYFEALDRDWEMIHFTVERIIGDGDDVAVVSRIGFRSRQGDAVFDSPKIDIWRFENGKAVSYFEMFDSLQFARVTGTLG